MNKTAPDIICVDLSGENPKVVDNQLDFGWLPTEKFYYSKKYVTALLQKHQIQTRNIQSETMEIIIQWLNAWNKNGLSVDQMIDLLKKDIVDIKEHHANIEIYLTKDEINRYGHE